jgi:hypothetical protein
MIEVVIAIYDPIVGCLDQTKEHRDRKERSEAVKPETDFRLKPSS